VTPFPFLSVQKNTAGGIQQVQSTSNSHYDSLQVSATKRLSNGLQFLAAYTFGKSIDYYSGSSVNELAAIAGDQFDWRSNRGLSDFDRRHRFVYSFVYDLPRVDVKSSAVRALLNRWQVNGILTLQSGTPYSIVQAPDNNTIQRANLAPGFSGSIDGSGSTTSRLTQYFNKAAFVPSNLASATFDPNAPFGNTGRNILIGPGQKNFDFSVVKFIPISERFNAEFRTEFFNLFNWANFANPANNISVPLTFGSITATSTGPRVIQFAAKLNF
jgi:hypothetical protein